MNVYSAVSLEQSTRFSRAQKTFTITRQGKCWHLSDEQDSIGGIFVSLEAALAFVRRDVATGTTPVRTVIVDSSAA
jgi:hypothetical protein